MQNTTPVPVPDGDLLIRADGSRIYVYPRFTCTSPDFKTCNPSDHPPRASPVDAILEAVRAGDLAKVTSLVADASYSPDEYLERALIAAVKEDQLEIGRYLLDHGAVMDKPVLRIMPGNYASRNKSLPFMKLFDHEFVTWLLAHGADPNLGRIENGIVYDGNLLELAALCSTLEIFDKLIAHGARLEDSRALHHASAADRVTPLSAEHL
ncbi:hypothetical protein VE02_05308 [Pseudogymnoascus sp. 03VT05]|nr:hypothetical protein VE02_05308 [Pseudogymnoascus sp. 03VT05]